LRGAEVSDFGIDFLPLPSNLPPESPSSLCRTYAIHSDCTGTAIINYPDGSWIDLELVITNHGREFRTVVSALTMGGNPVPVNIGSSGMRVGDEDGD